MSRCKLWIAVGVAAAFAVLGRPQPGLVDGIAHPQRWLASAGLDHIAGEIASAALWCLAVWFLVAVGLSALSTAPGLCGRLSARICEYVVPAAVRRFLARTTGVGLLLSPVSALPALAASPPAASPLAASPAAASPVPAPAWPTNGGAHPAHPTAPTPPSSGHRQPATSSTQIVIVRPGDSLWRIAQSRLPATAGDAEIAAAWPRWYAANRTVIGPDPDLIKPGQRLHAPTTRR